MSWGRKLLALGAVVVLSVTLTGGSVSVAEQSTSDGDWATWQKDLVGSRYAAAEHRINAKNVKNLKLKWAFAYPKTESTVVRSAPAVVGDTIYFGGSDGKFYARNARDRRREVGVRPGVRRPGGSGRRVGQPGGRERQGVLRRRARLLLRARRPHRRAEVVDPHRLAPVRPSSPARRSSTKDECTSACPAARTREGRDYPCCTFRGHLDSLDANTGELKWRYYTVPEPQQVGTWPSGAAKYEPSGAGVWSSPVIDPRTGTLYVGTGQNYTGSGGDFDTLLALDARTGGVRWKNKVTEADTWRVLCNDPDPKGYCPGLADGTALDYDIGATPNIFRVGDRTLVGVGQKVGVYHVFDARTGEVVWRRQLGVPLPSGGIAGIQWGSSYDGKRLYISTYYADPGTLFAVNPANGDVLWQTPNPADGCTTGGAAQYPELCALAHAPAAASSPGLVWEGSADGKFRAYDSANGRVLWTYDTIRTFTGVNGIEGMGSAIAGPGGGAVIAHGMVYVQSGYAPEYSTEKGHVLLAFGL